MHRSRNLQYVGMTSRSLEARIKEHFRVPSGLLAEAIEGTRLTDWQMEVIAITEDRGIALSAERQFIVTFKANLNIVGTQLLSRWQTAKHRKKRMDLSRLRSRFRQVMAFCQRG